MERIIVTMTIPANTEVINVVTLKAFSIDMENRTIFISFDYGYKDPSNNVKDLDHGHITLEEQKLTQLLNANLPNNKTFKQWIRPLIYAEIADYLGVPIGDID